MSFEKKIIQGQVVVAEGIILSDEEVDPMPDKITVVYDEYKADEYPYKKVDETDAEYETRMRKYRERLAARMSPEAKRQAEELLQKLEKKDN